ncbi:MAG: sulfatase [Pseudomonadota bacterium]
MRLVTIIAAFGLILPCAGPHFAAAAPYEDDLTGASDAKGSRPNIIFVLADDLGYGDIGANGATMIATPHIDRLAAEGVRLTSFYAPANVCTPSRAGFLTGRHPIRMGLAAGVIFPQSTHGLPQAETTLPELLKTRGYHTAMVGKWHLGHTPEFWPTEHGFDSFYGVPYSNDMTPFPLYDGAEKIEEPADQSTLTERYTAAAVAAIETAGDGPFFLYVAHTFPHIPLFASEEFRARSQAGLYGDTVETIDWSMGELRAALERTGKAEDTLIVFTSDNGPWFEGDAGVSRDRKGSGWEGAYRVPFIAWWPGGLPSGGTVGEPVSGLDLFPTFAGLAGAEPSDRVVLDGRDIWPVLRGEAPSPHDHLLFFDEDQIAAVRRGDWRLVLQSYYKTYDVPLDAFGYPLLFDLSRDPGETYSLAREEPERTSAMLELVEQARSELDVPEREPFSPE